MKKKRKLPLLIIGIVLVLAIIFFLQKQSENRYEDYSLPISSGRTSTKFSSLDISLAQFEEYSVSEVGGRLSFVKNGDTIYISRTGTSFDNIDDYILELDQLNSLNVLENAKMSINDYESVVRVLKFKTGETQKVYYIYVDNWVYSIYTQDPDLYGDLDQIAQSFKYLSE